MNGREPLVLACECGSTLKMSSLSQSEYGDAYKFWRERHGSHVEVDCASAAAIRASETSAERKRKHRAAS